MTNGSTGGKRIEMRSQMNDDTNIAINSSSNDDNDDNLQHCQLDDDDDDDHGRNENRPNPESMPLQQHQPQQQQPQPQPPIKRPRRRRKIVRSTTTTSTTVTTTTISRSNESVSSSSSLFAMMSDLRHDKEDEEFSFHQHGNHHRRRRRRRDAENKQQQQQQRKQKLMKMTTTLQFRSLPILLEERRLGTIVKRISHDNENFNGNGNGNANPCIINSDLTGDQRNAFRTRRCRRRLGSLSLPTTTTLATLASRIRNPSQVASYASTSSGVSNVEFNTAVLKHHRTEEEEIATPLLSTSRSGSIKLVTTTRPKTFQQNMLKSYLHVPPKPTMARRQWRPYLMTTTTGGVDATTELTTDSRQINSASYRHTRIAFTSLPIQPEDAVLALHKDANYTLSLGSYNDGAHSSASQQGLALKFHLLPPPPPAFPDHARSPHDRSFQVNNGIGNEGPSNGSFSSSSQHPRPISINQIYPANNYGDADDASNPFLWQTVPLLSMTTAGLRSSSDIVHDGNNSVIGGGTSALSPATTPVELILSSDWTVGVCRLRPSSTSQWTDISSTSSTSSNRQQQKQQQKQQQPELAPVGSLVLFTLPHGRRCRRGRPTLSSDSSSSSYSRLYRCTNVQVVSNSGMTTRNLLWKVNTIPQQQRKPQPQPNSCDELLTQHVFDVATKNSVFKYYREIPAYLFLNDEADGFRLTWTTNVGKSYLDRASCHAIAQDKQTTNDGICNTTDCGDVITVESTWEEQIVDLVSGKLIDDPVSIDRRLIDDDEGTSASIVAEAYLHVDCLLAQILHKQQRKKEQAAASGQRQQENQAHEAIPQSQQQQHHKSAHTTQSEFCYNLISIQQGGRVAELIISYLRHSSNKHKSGIGVFVNVDLYTGSYIEKNWVQDKQVSCGASLQFWCTKLALNRRMKQVHAGPYSTYDDGTNRSSVDWTKLCREVGNIDPDRDDDFDPNYWDGIVTGGGGGSRSTGNGRERQQKKPRTQSLSQDRSRPPKAISFASLYPCCDIVTNQALIVCQPVPCIRAKNSPVQLVYG